MTDQTRALALWLAEQQQASRLAQQQAPGEIHLHQHHHHAPTRPPVAEPEQPQTVRLHPLALATYALLLSIAISVPLALLGAMVDALNRPSVEYVQPSRGGW
ncbi:MAG: hypothetical protein DCF32_06285 [Leptolyngbya sp.]|nr:MAG: hypothetical protein DCF32_06285 [Leptolyngbya sp.]